MGLAFGDGCVVHAWDDVRVDDARAVEQLSPAAGWTAPRLIGRTPPARILEGHRRRDWSDG